MATQVRRNGDVDRRQLRLGFGDGGWFEVGRRNDEAALVVRVKKARVLALEGRGARDCGIGAGAISSSVFQIRTGGGG